MFKLILALAVIACLYAGWLYISSKNDTTYKNSDIHYSTSFSDIWQMLVAYTTVKRQNPVPEQPLPVQTITPASLANAVQPVVYRLGHSTVLIGLDGEFLLTDPVFSKRASPVQWFGPERFHPLPIALEDLPKIKAVVISHDHYDHLDKHSILSLAAKVEHFVVPLGVAGHLKKWGIAEDKIIERDWWQTVELGHITLTATPAQHFSGRKLTDKDSTLWAGWAIRGRQVNIFYSGDSGYFSGFKEIGQRLGPFDMTLMETGAYNTMWDEIHMMPEQSLQAHIDVKGKTLLPVHNGTFDLALHDWQEPFESIYALSRERGIDLHIPQFGEPVYPLAPYPSTSIKAWWRDYLTAPPVHVGADLAH